MRARARARQETTRLYLRSCRKSLFCCCFFLGGGGWEVSNARSVRRPGPDNQLPGVPRLPETGGPIYGQCLGAASGAWPGLCGGAPQGCVFD